MSDAERCIVCGCIIPEGMQICPRCARNDIQKPEKAECQCKGCEYRSATCHSTCESYRKYKEWMEYQRRVRFHDNLENPAFVTRPGMNKKRKKTHRKGWHDDI